MLETIIDQMTAKNAETMKNFAAISPDRMVFVLESPENGISEDNAGVVIAFKPDGIVTVLTYDGQRVDAPLSAVLPDHHRCRTWEGQSAYEWYFDDQEICPACLTRKRRLPKFDGLA